MAGAVMVVERREAAAAERAVMGRLLPSLLSVARPGLKGDREGVSKAVEAVCRDLAEAGVVEVAPLVQLLTAFRAEVEADALAARDPDAARPARLDVLSAMASAGTLNEQQFLAGVELRTVAQLLGMVGSVAAQDLTKPVVDGGGWWKMPDPAGGWVMVTPMIARARAWAEWIRKNGCGYHGRRGRATAAELVYRVVVQNESCAALDSALGIRKGSVAAAVSAALAMYVSLHGAAVGEGA